MPGLTKNEAAGYLRCVQAGTLSFNPFKVGAALALLNDGTTVEQFQSFLTKARRVERRSPPFVLLTPTGSGRNR